MTSKVLPTPVDIVKHLDKFVVGQTAAKELLASSAYYHFMGKQYRSVFGQDLGRHHIMMVGPTGVGKTLMVRRLSELLEVPIVMGSATSLVEMGYKGNSVDSLVQSLLDRTKKDVKRAEMGIIYIDEIDKLRVCDEMIRDVSGRGVQNALLTMLDGRICEGIEGSKHEPVDSGKILFIVTGAFAGLTEITKSRLEESTASKKRSLGFKTTGLLSEETCEELTHDELLKQVTTEDFCKYGMIPEFMGRFNSVAILRELNRTEMLAIIGGKCEGSPIDTICKLAKIHGIQLQITNDGLEALVDKALTLKTGARAIQRVLNETLGFVKFNLPKWAESGVTRVVIDRKFVQGDTDGCIQVGARYFTRSDNRFREDCLRGIVTQLPNPTATTVEKRQVIASSSESPTGKEKNEANKVAAKNPKEFSSFRWGKAPETVRRWWNSYEREHKGKSASWAVFLSQCIDRRISVNELFDCRVNSLLDSPEGLIAYFDLQVQIKKERTKKSGSDR